jgi:hypothetical protein
VYVRRRRIAVQTFIEYLESELGTIAGGLRFEVPAEQDVGVARFENQPVPEAITYVTTGLSRHLLHQLEKPDLRVELVGCVWARFRDSGLDSLLHIVAREILESHHAPPRGFVMGPSGPIIPGSELQAFYFMHPAYHGEALECFEHPTDPVYLAWPVPITVAEAVFIARSGWSAFEERLFAADPDLMDLDRRSFL